MGKRPLIFCQYWMDLAILDQAKKIGEMGKIIFIASFSEPEFVFEQLAIIYALPKYEVKSLKVIFTDFPEEEEYYSNEFGIVRRRETICRMLSVTPRTVSGRVKFYQATGDLQKLKEIKPHDYPLINYKIFTNPPKDRKTVCFYHPLRKAMAEELKKGSDYPFEIGKICRDDEKAGEWVSQAILDDDKVVGRDVVYLAAFHNLRSFIEEMEVIYHLASCQIRSFKVIVPFYPVGTMERVEEEGQIATAKTMARILSAIPMIEDVENEEKIPANIYVFDIHALQGWFYFGDEVNVVLKTAVPLLLSKIKRLKNVSIVFPDDGAYKRFGKMFPNYPKIICNKMRVRDERIVDIKEGDPKGKCCVIVDDLIQTGGTVIECRSALIGAGANKVSAFAPHGVFPERSWKKFTPDLFKRVWITDSCAPTAKILEGVAPFKVKSIVPLVQEILNE
jgi:phosphoribosylpyrophosphate synthetase